MHSWGLLKGVWLCKCSLWYVHATKRYGAFDVCVCMNSLQVQGENLWIESHINNFLKRCNTFNKWNRANLFRSYQYLFSDIGILWFYPKDEMKGVLPKPSGWVLAHILWINNANKMTAKWYFHRYASLLEFKGSFIFHTLVSLHFSSRWVSMNVRPCRFSCFLQK